MNLLIVNVTLKLYGGKKKSSTSKSEITKRSKIVTVIPETDDEDSNMDDFADTSFHQPIIPNT